MVTNRKQKTIKKYSYTRNGKRISVRKHKRHYNYAEKVAYRRISKKDAEKVMQKRSQRAISTDRRQSSRKLYDNPNSVWASNPSKTDVKGIDDKQKEKTVIPKKREKQHKKKKLIALALKKAESLDDDYMNEEAFREMTMKQIEEYLNTNFKVRERVEKEAEKAEKAEMDKWAKDDKKYQKKIKDKYDDFGLNENDSNTMTINDAHTFAINNKSHDYMKMREDASFVKIKKDELKEYVKFDGTPIKIYNNMVFSDELIHKFEKKNQNVKYHVFQKKNTSILQIEGDEENAYATSKTAHGSDGNYIPKHIFDEMMNSGSKLDLAKKWNEANRDQEIYKKEYKKTTKLSIACDLIDEKYIKTIKNKSSGYDEDDDYDYYDD